MADAGWIKANFPGYAGWNDSAAIEADFRDTGGRGKEGPGGGGGGSAAALPASNVPSFEDAYKRGFETLKPYYQKVLDLAKGDTELAKRIIQSDYDLGMRETKSEYELKKREQAMTFPQESRQLLAKYDELGVLEPQELRRLEANYKELAIAEPAEAEALQTQLNRRGISISGIAEKETERLAGTQSLRRERLETPQELSTMQKARREGMTRTDELKESQDVRALMIERALEEKELRLGKEKEFGVEKEGRGLTRETLSTGQEHEREARGLAESEIGRKRAIEGTELQKYGIKEQTRLADLSRSLYT